MPSFYKISLFIGDFALRKIYTGYADTISYMLNSLYGTLSSLKIFFLITKYYNKHCLLKSSYPDSVDLCPNFIFDNKK